MSDGKAFENDVALIYEILASIDGVSVVTKDEKVSGPDGTRQLDVVIRSQVAGHEILTIIECKDHSRPTTVQVIDELWGKLGDLSANKGVIVSRSGFSRTAIQKAKRLGISLCTVNRLKNAIENPFSMLPIVVKFIDPQNFYLNFTPLVGDRTTGARININELVSGFGLMDLVKICQFNDLLRSEKIEAILTEDLVGCPLFLNGTDGKKLYIENCKFGFDMSMEIYFGFASQLPETLVRSEIGVGLNEVYISARDLGNAHEHFIRYSSFEELPEYLKRSHVSVLSFPDSISSVGQIKIYGRKKLQG